MVIHGMHVRAPKVSLLNLNDCHTDVLAASHVWFCHPENVYMNRRANRVGIVARIVAEKTSCLPVVLYPGDAWEVGKYHDFVPAAEKYQRDRAQNVAGVALSPARHVSEEVLLAHGEAFVGKLRTENKTLRLLLLEPTRIYVADPGVSFPTW